jgi:ATP sulfurylase
MPIPPHGGGELVDLRVPQAERSTLLDFAKPLKKLALDARELTDLELLAIGGYSPLRGFMTS